MEMGDEYFKFSVSFKRIFITFRWFCVIVWYISCAYTAYSIYSTIYSVLLLYDETFALSVITEIVGIDSLRLFNLY